MILFLLNLLLALVWFLLAEPPHWKDFVVGFVLGFLLIAAFRNLFKEDLKKGVIVARVRSDYVRRVIAFLWFAIWFLYEFMMSNFRVAYVVLFVPAKKIDPHILKMDVTKLNDFEIVFLANCITLTPGTSTVKISDDHNTLWLHALDASAPESVLSDIENKLLKKILRFTR